MIVEKQADKDFVILQLTDMQLWTSSKDNNAAFEIAEQTIKKTNPDLVVFTGDNVSGVGVPELLKVFIKQIEELAQKYNFLWAPIFGNHDNEMRATPNWSGDQYLKVSRENGGHCLFRKGPTNLGDKYGNLLGNYVINVKKANKLFNLCICLTTVLMQNMKKVLWMQQKKAKAEAMQNAHSLTLR